MKTLKVIELFAGIGGFRVGLEKIKNPKTKFKIIWSNQYEPATKKQHASIIYKKNFGKKELNTNDINTIQTKEIPNYDILTAGFPCQDYSIASTLKNSKGIIGKKGILWWQIHRIIKEKQTKPKYILLENVDRLLKSPSTQKGRDFAIMLKSLHSLNYAIEWRIINAGEYGMPQKRKRVYILAYHKNSPIYKHIETISPLQYLQHESTITSAFPINFINIPHEIPLTQSLNELTKNFNKQNSKSPFENTGLVIHNKIYTTKTTPQYDNTYKTLQDIIEHKNIDTEFYINPKDIKKWEYIKGAKTIQRTSKTGYQYYYKEGKMAFPDELHNPARTIITSEGNKTPNRSTHIIKQNNTLRRLTPIEIEKLFNFPKNYTKHPEVTNTKRAFLLGNALIIDIITKLGKSLLDKI